MHDAPTAQERRVALWALAAVLLGIGLSGCLYYIRHMCDWQCQRLHTAQQLEEFGYFRLPAGAVIVDGRFRHSACHGSCTVARVRLNEAGLAIFWRLNRSSGKPLSDVGAVQELVRDRAPIELRNVYRLKVQEGWTAEMFSPSFGYIADPGAKGTVDLYVFRIY
jgi:hypothetical protein